MPFHAPAFWRWLRQGVLHAFRLPLSAVLAWVEVGSCKYNRLKEIVAIYIQIESIFSIFNSKNAIEEVINEFNSSEIKYTIIDITIFADYLRFKQVIYNLISNAIKYGEKGKSIEILSYIL